MLLYYVCFVWTVLLQQINNVHSQGFEMIYPKDGDVLIQSDRCYGEKSTSLCVYPFYLFGWFPPYKRKHIPYDQFAFPFELLFKIDNQVVDKRVFPSFLYFHKDPLNVVALNYEFFLPSIDRIKGRLFELEVVLVDRLSVIHYQHKFIFLLASGTEFYWQTASPSQLSFSSFPTTATPPTVYEHPIEEIMHRFLRSTLSKLPDEQMPKKLDYFEIGTSDFDTILHVLDSEKQKKEQVENSNRKSFVVSGQCLSRECPNTSSRIGISMDAVRNYINRIPVIENTLKIHSAVVPIWREPLNLTTLNRNSFPISHDISWVIAYYCPNYLVENHFPGNGFQKGQTEIHRINPHFLPLFDMISLTPSIIQRDYVQSITIPFLFSIIHQYFKEGINLLKTDIEGFDNVVMKDVLFYYRYYEELSGGGGEGKGRLSLKYPCILFFESDFEEKIRNVELMSLLKEVGYKLLHEYPVNFDIRKTESSFPHVKGLKEKEEELSEEMKDAKVDLMDRNTMAINCKCDRSQLVDGWKLLNISFILELNSNLFNRVCLE
jgi:hypothetical protein